MGNDFRAGTRINQEHLARPEPAWRYSVQTAALVAVLILFIPGLCLSAVIFALLPAPPCIPPEVKADSGAALAFGAFMSLECAISTPFVALLGGLFGYITFRYLRTRREEANLQLATVFSGVASALVFIVLIPVLLNYLICSL